MKRRVPLYAQLLLWLALNLALIAGLYASMPGSGGSAWAMLLSKPVRERLADIAERLASELSAQQDPSKWSAILSAYGARYSVEFELLDSLPGQDRDHGPRGPPPDRAMPPGPPPDIAGNGGPIGPPPWDNGHAPPGPGGGPPGDSGDRGPPPMPPRGRERLANMITVDRGRDAGGEPGYRVLMPADLKVAGQPARPRMVLAHTRSLIALLGFLGVQEWVSFALLALLLSILLWWPFVWSITRTVGQLTRAAQRIAEGRFDTRVASARRDELGALAEAVNRMAQRLQDHAAGQRQFVADVAHEVTSPLARVQVGLAILESRLGETGEVQLRDVHDDVQQMSELLNELLLFSRAGMEADQAPLQVIIVSDVVSAVLARDDAVTRVQASIDAQLRVLAHPAMLARALSNLVRNALRYASAGDAPIEIVAVRSARTVRIAVRDRGPGVPDSALARLGEPFFRTDEARARESGGYGLGLTIVRRCAEACGGSANFRNRRDGGFEAELQLDAAD